MDEQNEFTNGTENVEKNVEDKETPVQENPIGENAGAGASPYTDPGASGQTGGNFNGWQSYQGAPNPGNPYPQQPPAGNYGGYPGNAPNGGFQNFGGQQTPPQAAPQNPQEYRWSYEDYDKISQGNVGYKPKNNTGLKVFAAVMTVVFLVTAAAFAGFILYSRSRNGGDAALDNNISSSSSESRRDGPQLSLENRPAADEEEYTDGVLSTEEIAAKVRPSVVGIQTYRTEYPMQVYGTGSGIIMSEDGYIVTNAHVVSGATGGILVILDNNEEYEAEVVGIDEKTDVAVIKIDASNLTAAEFGNSDELVVGERIVAIGNPTGMNLAGSVTQGIVSGLKRLISVTNEETNETIEMEAIQVDAAINPGNSGGALINKYGQVVGINSSKMSSTQIEGIGFAIPISTAKPIVDDLIAYGYVRGRVLLGITYYPVSDAVGAMSGYTPGLWVQSVREDMDAYAKGLRAGDIITQIDGQDVRDSATVKGILSAKKPGDSVELTVVQQSISGKIKTYTINVTLAEDKGTSQSTGSGSNEPSIDDGSDIKKLPFGE